MRGGPIRSALLLPALAITAACQQPAIAAEKPVNAPVADLRSTETGKLRTAIFAGGCFWGVEGVFSHVKGVKSAVSGYHGGGRAGADYKEVSSGRTGHAEAVKVTYDPDLVRYDQLLRIFFSVITDPTQLNRQGPDVGAHYRSALVPLNADQSSVAAAYLAQLAKAGLWDKPIVTKIERYKAFYPAEDYHQDFMLKNPRHPYIQRWDAPKVAAFKEMHPGAYKAAFTRN
ncbi:MAG: peptide-methionine (S)-S-oxide reductase MsrA [Sphingomonadaceae bacterium]